MRCVPWCVRPFFYSSVKIVDENMQNVKNVCLIRSLIYDPTDTEDQPYAPSSATEPIINLFFFISLDKKERLLNLIWQWLWIWLLNCTVIMYRNFFKNLWDNNNKGLKFALSNTYQSSISTNNNTMTQNNDVRIKIVVLLNKQNMMKIENTFFRITMLK